VYTGRERARTIVDDEDDDPKYNEEVSEFNGADRVLMTTAFINLYNKLKNKAEYYRAIESADSFKMMIQGIEN
jgi:hypothetical protein